MLALQPVIGPIYTLVPYLNLKDADPIVKYTGSGYNDIYEYSPNWQGASQNSYSQEDTESKKYYGFKYYAQHVVPKSNVVDWPPASANIPKPLPMQYMPGIFPFDKLTVGKLMVLSHPPTNDYCHESSAEYTVGEPFDEFDKKNLQISDDDKAGKAVQVFGFVKGLTPLGTEPNDNANTKRLEVFVSLGDKSSYNSDYASQNAGLITKNLSLHYTGFSAVPKTMTIGRPLYWSKTEADKFFTENPFGYEVGTSVSTTIGGSSDKTKGSKTRVLTGTANAGSGNSAAQLFAVGKGSGGQAAVGAGSDAAKDLWKLFKP
jgi:hypothetical protein